MGRKKNIKLRMTRGEIISAIIMTIKISLKAGRGSGFLTIAYTILESAINPLIAVLEGATVTALVTSVITKDFMPVLWLFLALLAIQLVTNLASRYIMLKRSRVWQDVRAYTDEIMALKYVRLPLATRESKAGAELFERAGRFQGNIASIFNDAIHIAGSTVGFVTAFITLFVISPLLAGVIVVATIPLAIVEFRQMKNSEVDWRKFSMERRKAWRMSSMLTDKDESFEIEVNGLTKYFAKRMVQLRQTSAQKDVERERKFFWPRFLTETVEALISTGALIYVAIEIMFGRLEIGQFVTIRSLIRTLSTSASAAFRSVSTIGSDLIGANDFVKFMEQPEQIGGPETIPLSTVPRIEFRDVFFRYPDSDHYALRNISLVMEPGEDIAIVGENGAGKSTLIKLLLGAYEPETGEILIDGIPLQRLKRVDYLRHIGTLLQQFSQYNFATLGENVWYGDIHRPYDENRILRALRRAGASSTIAALPKGLKQILSREFDETTGTSLSGGQWQKIALARSFFRNPNILVLDEPTSAIDAKAEYEIFKEIMDAQKTKTTIIISHRFSTVRKAQQIIVMSRGQIVEHGTHAELMHHGGLYREMFELQAEGYK